jgi:predicted 3-demethylubiquinone-9 3-methyltransferase (glyoxalase superfamily)
MAAKTKICLWFDRSAEDAARFYTSVLRDGSIGRTTRYLDPDPTPANRPGEVMTVEFSVEGLDFLALDGGPAFTINEAVSFMLYRETQEEIDETWDALLEGGGEPGPCGWLKDRFGVSWQVTPTILDELVSDDDPQVARRATDAMLGMGKIDIAALHEAVGSVRA